MEQRVELVNEQNENRDHRERIYISYDATNKNCEAGDIELAEMGPPIEVLGLLIFNSAIAYARNKSEPL